MKPRRRTPTLGRDESAFYKAVGARLQKFRKARMMSQTELAKALGLDQSAVSRIESGKQALSLYHRHLIGQKYAEYL